MPPAIYHVFWIIPKKHLTNCKLAAKSLKMIAALKVISMSVGMFYLSQVHTSEAEKFMNSM